MENKPVGLPDDWQADGFVVLNYDGIHYDLLVDEASATATFTFGQLPIPIRDQILAAAPSSAHLHFTFERIFPNLQLDQNGVDTAVNGLVHV